MTDKLISAAVLAERREELKARIEEQREMRADDDPFFRVCDWMLDEWVRAERDAAKVWVPTQRASEMTGWSDATLRKYARALKEAEPMPPGWEGLLARRSGKDWTFCISTIPMKSSEAA